MRWLTRYRAALFVCVAVLLQSCASSGPLNNARNQFYSGQPQAALETLNSESVSKRNRLLVNLDQGLIAHTAGEYEQSIEAFKRATTLLNEMDFISVREQSASLITNDWVAAYKGEYNERLWIHTFQMMNFLLLGKAEGAAVEARQALKLYDEHGNDLKNDWYTRTLIAMSFEAAGKPDSAHIEYKKLLNDIGSDKGMARRAWQNAMRLGRGEDARQFKGLVRSNTNIGDKGELVLFLQTGSIPPKIAGQIHVDSLYASFPVYPEIQRPDIYLNIEKDGLEQQADIINVQLVDVARSALAARAGRITAKQILRIAAKKNLAHAASKESELLGALLSVAFVASEVADTRSWETLPAHVSLVQIPLSEGKHTLNLQITEGSREYEIKLSNIDIRSRQNTYRSLRIGAGAPTADLPDNSAQALIAP